MTAIDPTSAALERVIEWDRQAVTVAEERLRLDPALLEDLVVARRLLAEDEDALARLRAGGTGQ